MSYLIPHLTTVKGDILFKSLNMFLRDQFNKSSMILSKLDEIIEIITEINQKTSTRPIIKKLDEIIDIMNDINRKGSKTQHDIRRLTEKVQENKNIMASAIILITKLAEQIVINKNSPEAIQALADELDKSSKLLAQAVTDNIPSDKTPEDLPRES
jgi:uncharacterized protein YjgD (DUF1641 family)